MRIGILFDSAATEEGAPEGGGLPFSTIDGTVEHIREALSAEHRVFAIPFTREVVPYLSAASLDLVFNICEGFGGDPSGEAWVAGMLDILGIPYTGSGPLALGTCQDKLRAKLLLSSVGVPTPRWQLFKAAGDPLDAALRFPLIVKPVSEDASIGITRCSVVADEARLREQVSTVLERHSQPALVEEYIDGRELNVALLGNAPSPEVLPVSEIAFDLAEGRPRIVCYDAKWNEGSEEYRGTVGVCPAPLDEAVRLRVGELAARAFEVCGCRDYARVDIRLRGEEPFVLEVNPNPDIDVDSGFFRSARAAGMDYQGLVARIVTAAMGRRARAEGPGAPPATRAEPVPGSHVLIRRRSPAGTHRSRAVERHLLRLRRVGPPRAGPVG